MSSRESQSSPPRTAAMSAPLSNTPYTGTENHRELENQMMENKNFRPKKLYQPCFVKEPEPTPDPLFPPDTPFLTGPIPMTQSTVLAWLVRGTRYETKESVQCLEQQPCQNKDTMQYGEMLQAFHNRRQEMRELASMVERGEARIDQDGRLVRTRRGANNEHDDAAPGNNNAQNPEDQHDHVVQNNGAENINAAQQELVEERPQDANNNIQAPIPIFMGNVRAEDEEEERRLNRQQDRDAADTIDRFVRRYREAGVSEEEFELIRVPSNEPSPGMLTFRRISVAVLTVVTAFICILFQTLPIFGGGSYNDPAFDKAMHEVVNVRDFETHVQRCGLDLSRYDSGPMPWREWWLSFIQGDKSEEYFNCADGVLHIPAMSTVAESYESHRRKKREKPKANVYQKFLNGFNVSWSHECNLPPHLNASRDPSCHPGFYKPNSDGDTVNNNTCSDKGSTDKQCFRGVHDGVVSVDETDEALRMASYLIQEKGGDHVHIRRDTDEMEDWIPSIVDSLADLLHDQYNTTPNIEPVAFRVSVSLPLDSSILLRHYSTKGSLLVQAINATVYQEWDDLYRMQNELAAFSLPPPFSSKPFRDPCLLLSDLEASPDFTFHTSVFLSDGAGEHFMGGAALYVDDGYSKNPRRKIQRGVTVDGSRGRVVVSTGGLENQRCRLPTRSGIRAVLQIWWACADDDNASP
uniref:Uncharacterized protein n=1 Tax=Attheya septentrionalis TaxID=420275 RepID=A0A7S2XKM3_9STRA|mmetsp:Transcript_1483/g.2663  ORF Transcript_1483/g.2663 Transcript_1483/m.2663 type:complete len:692 (+) Transcript_1483:261-2336(+)|eukprot:CAMPEP_0198283948 /NCGR_PEP_ID=MMETSP1449-20131203/3529_1 /TAXON_ID=420275 /ORGANISM="Attheya septentrionalis, Strain CCMP2084" /LENGTH=691 /DNA_ID=CAMNT_0043980851 /DNA_START=167 /DNA_END=2242 /DNA_ORIENTATION=+